MLVLGMGPYLRAPHLSAVSWTCLTRPHGQQLAVGSALHGFASVPQTLTGEELFKHPLHSAPWVLADGASKA